MTTVRRRYPFISLEEAVARAEQLHEKDGFSPINYSVAMKHWNYSPKSSGGLQTIAALKHYELIEDEGSGKSRKVKLTPIAKQILLDKRIGSVERELALQHAALNPKLFRELWSIVGDEGKISDDNLIHTLVFDWQINDRTARSIVKKFRETLEFANLYSSDSLSGQDEEETSYTDEPHMQTQSIQPEHKQVITPAGKQIGAAIPVTQECSISIVAEGPVTQKGIDQLVAYLNLIKESFPESGTKNDEDES